MFNPLTEDQLKQLPQDEGERVVRFMGRTNPLQARSMLSVNLTTGDTLGGNVIYQYVYWDRPTEFVDTALGFLRQNNPGMIFNVIDSE